MAEQPISGMGRFGKFKDMVRAKVPQLVEVGNKVKDVLVPPPLIPEGPVINKPEAPQRNFRDVVETNKMRTLQLKDELARLKVTSDVDEREKIVEKIAELSNAAIQHDPNDPTLGKRKDGGTFFDVLDYAYPKINASGEVKHSPLSSKAIGTSTEEMLDMAKTIVQARFAMWDQSKNLYPRGSVEWIANLKYSLMPTPQDEMYESALHHVGIWDRLDISLAKDLGLTLAQQSELKADVQDYFTAITKLRMTTYKDTYFPISIGKSGGSVSDISLLNAMAINGVSIVQLQDTIRKEVPDFPTNSFIMLEKNDRFNEHVQELDFWQSKRYGHLNIKNTGGDSHSKVLWGAMPGDLKPKTESPQSVNTAKTLTENDFKGNEEVKQEWDQYQKSLKGEGSWGTNSFTNLFLPSLESDGSLNYRLFPGASGKDQNRTFRDIFTNDFGMDEKGLSQSSSKLLDTTLSGIKKEIEGIVTSMGARIEDVARAKEEMGSVSGDEFKKKHAAFNTQYADQIYFRMRLLGYNRKELVA